MEARPLTAPSKQVSSRLLRSNAELPSR